MAAARFELEARSTASFEHENIVRVIDFGRSSDGAMYLVMEQLEGRSLFAELSETPRLPTARAVSIALQILAGLDAAHGHGIIHRDLKPENVFLTELPSGATRVKLLDFGIALLAEGGGPRLTTAGALLGTPLYMSPEQATGRREVDHRVDIHGTGVLLYEMLAGRLPYLGETWEAVLIAIDEGHPAPLAEVAPGVPQVVSAIVMKALATDPDARYPTAAAMHDALAGWAGAPALHRSIQMTPPVADRGRVAAAASRAETVASSELSAARAESIANPVAEAASSRRPPSSGERLTSPRAIGRLVIERWEAFRALYADNILRGVVSLALPNEASAGAPITVEITLPDGAVLELPGLVVDASRPAKGALGEPASHHITARIDPPGGEARRRIASLLERHPPESRSSGRHPIIRMPTPTDVAAAARPHAPAQSPPARRAVPAPRPIERRSRSPVPVDSLAPTVGSSARAIPSPLSSESAAGSAPPAPSPPVAAAVERPTTEVASPAVPARTVPLSGRRMIIETLAMCLEGSPIGALVDGRLLRADLDASVEVNPENGDISLERTFQTLLLRPRVTPALLATPLRIFKSYENGFGAIVTLPAGLPEVDREEQARARAGAGLKPPPTGPVALPAFLLADRTPSRPTPLPPVEPSRSERRWRAAATGVVVAVVLALFAILALLFAG